MSDAQAVNKRMERIARIDKHSAEAALSSLSEARSLPVHKSWAFHSMQRTF